MTNELLTLCTSAPCEQIGKVFRRGEPSLGELRGFHLADAEYLLWAGNIVNLGRARTHTHTHTHTHKHTVSTHCGVGIKQWQHELLELYRAGSLRFQDLKWWLDSGTKVPFYQAILDVQVGHLLRFLSYKEVQSVYIDTANIIAESSAHYSIAKCSLQEHTETRTCRVCMRSASITCWHFALHDLTHYSLTICRSSHTRAHSYTQTHTYPCSVHRTHIYPHKHTHPRTHAHPHTHTHTHTHTHAHTHTHTDTHTRSSTHSHTRQRSARTHARTIHVYAHTHTHTQTHTELPCACIGKYAMACMALCPQAGNWNWIGFAQFCER